MMLDDQREDFAAALIRQGKSINTVDDAELDAALALLKEQRPLVRKYSGDAIGDMKSGDIWVGHDWSGDIWTIQETRPSITFVLPEEGGVRGSDAAVDLCRAPRTPSRPTCSSTTCSTRRSAPRTRTPSTTWAPTPRPRSSSCRSCSTDPSVNPDQAILDKLQELLDLGADLDKYAHALPGAAVRRLSATERDRPRTDRPATGRRCERASARPSWSCPAWPGWRSSSWSRWASS